MEPLPGMGRVRKKGDMVKGIWSRMETQDPKEGAGPGAQTLASPSMFPVPRGQRPGPNDPFLSFTSPMEPTDRTSLKGAGA